MPTRMQLDERLAFVPSLQSCDSDSNGRDSARPADASTGRAFIAPQRADTANWSRNSPVYRGSDAFVAVPDEPLKDAIASISASA